MDAIDAKILRCLSRNARQKASGISQEINLSVSAVIERIHKMEDSGLIERYTTVLNQKKLGNDISALMELSLEHPKHYDAFVEKIMGIHNVVACHYLTGDFDFMLQIVASSSEALEVLHRQIKSMEGVSSTRTHFVLKTVKDEATLLPEGAYS
ncbi:MAG: Lrp/AsnC family transcriptional regulator [Oscillospiraceae bacterium]|jgi:Lrp/AsnC family leucine-responsive transcriptional regulator|nr:Lrp/AsnC family transcriptional regulator [Oscillospiraceae bacterium]